MNNWTKFTLAGLGLIGSGIGLTLWSGFSKWNAETENLVEKLKSEQLPAEKKTISFADFERLPAPVAKYFRLVLKEGQPIIKMAQIKQEGEFLLGENWIPFTATEYFSNSPAAFVWDADMQMNPLMNVRVCDAFLEGKGLMRAKILSLFTVADSKDAPELDAGALQRYLGEGAWIPTSLLPNENLSWSEIDDQTALATLTESGTTVSLEFRFNEKGEITEVFTPGRYREIGGNFEKTPWMGRFWNYAERNEMLVPLEAEVEWHLPTGKTPYWKGHVTDAEYVFE